MTDAVETMAWSKTGGVPWHGLGFPVDNNLTPKQMLDKAKIAWTVSKQPVFRKLKDGTYAQIHSEFLLQRDTDEQFLSMVGSKWKEVQNSDAAEFFSKWVKAGHMEMETMGSLWNGRYVWCLARVKKDFALPGKKDEVRSYLLLLSPHVRGKAMIIQFTPIRVVCWNTLCFALGASLKGKAGAFRILHGSGFGEAQKRQAEIALGLATERMDEFKEASLLLAKAKAKKEEVEEYFCEVIKFNPAEAKAEAKKAKKEVREPIMLPKFRLALTHAPGQNLNTATGTWWGALNAVTAVVDHQGGSRSPETGLKNIWLGNHATVKRRAFDLAMKRAS